HPGDRLRRRDPRAVPLRHDAAESRDRAARRRPPADPTDPVAAGNRGVRAVPAGRDPEVGRAVRLFGAAEGICGDRTPAPRPVFAGGAAVRGGVGPPARLAHGRLPPDAADREVSVPLTDALFVSGALFCLGLAGALLRRNAITIFLSIELMLNGANLALAG